MSVQFMIDKVPAVLYGEKSDKVFLFVHGQGGNKEEAARFAEIAVPAGWQVLGIDLPEHGTRRDSVKLLPWEVIAELQTVMHYIRQKWRYVGIRANSIGAWFSMLAFQKSEIEKCLFVSPVLDMEDMIFNMMKWACVTEQQLKEQGEIATNFGQTLSWRYLCWVRQNPVCSVGGKTYILYGTADNLIGQKIVDGFVQKNNCHLTYMKDGEHWFHTQAQLDFLRKWEEDVLAGKILS